MDKIYGLTMKVAKPCGISGCPCARGTRYAALSYMPTKADILKLEPGLESAEVETLYFTPPMNHRQVLARKMFKRLHPGINSRRKRSKDTFSNWITL